MHGRGKIEFIIDEQNVATGAKYDLGGCLNQQLTLLAWKEKSIVTVALAACAVVFTGEWILGRMG